jgi:predicted dehydrogenase
VKKIRVGILGQGRSGFGIHAEWLKQDTEKWEIAAVADLLPERVKECADEHNARTFSNYKELLANAKEMKLDIIVNATPSFMHPQVTIDTLEAGFDVVCEKPMATTVEDFDKMCEIALKNNKKIYPFQNSRFQPAFIKIKEIIDSGKIGKLIQGRINFSNWSRRWDWQCLQEFSAGNLRNTGPHPLDQAVVLFGDDKPNVFARLVSENPYGDSDNFAAVTLYGDNRPTIEVVTSSFQAYPQGDMFNFGGTLGGITGTMEKVTWKYYLEESAKKLEQKGTWSDNRKYCEDSLEWVEETWSFKPTLGMFDFLCKGFYDNLYEILVNNAPRIITLEQVRRQVEVLEEAYRQNPMTKSLKTYL